MYTSQQVEGLIPGSKGGALDACQALTCSPLLMSSSRTPSTGIPSFSFPFHSAFLDKPTPSCPGPGLNQGPIIGHNPIVLQEQLNGWDLSKPLIHQTQALLRDQSDGC